MIYKYYFICTLLAVSLITSCAKKEEELVLNSVAPMSTLEGNWSVTCKNHFTKSAVFSGASFTAIEHIYENPSCAGSPAMTMSRTGTYDYAIMDQIDSVQFAEVEWTHDVFNLVVYSSDITTDMNSVSFCGYSDWIPGITKTLLGRTCDGVLFPNQGIVNYDSFAYVLLDKPEYELNAGDLMFGASDSYYNGSTPARRPVNFDATAPIRR